MLSRYLFDLYLLNCSYQFQRNIYNLEMESFYIYEVLQIESVGETIPFRQKINKTDFIFCVE